MTTSCQLTNGTVAGGWVTVHALNVTFCKSGSLAANVHHKLNNDEHKGTLDAAPLPLVFCVFFGTCAKSQTALVDATVAADARKFFDRSMSASEAEELYLFQLKH